MSMKQKGIFYGYPKCCIDSFLLNQIKRTRNQRMAQKITPFTGFIPCNECSIKILNNEETFDSLIKNRLSRYKFPKGKRPRLCRLKKISL